MSNDKQILEIFNITYFQRIVVTLSDLNRTSTDAMGNGGSHPKTKYHSIDDIPDSMIRTYSKRDPDNKVYQTRRWVNFKKKQILYNQPDGIPNYLRTPAGRYSYYGMFAASFALLFYNIYTYKKVMGGK